MLVIFNSIFSFGGNLKRYLFCISFNGFSYCGWQVQKNGISVQEVVQDATDSGVHAKNFYFNVDLKLKMELEKLKFAINNCMPQDVVVKEIFVVDWNFHARYSVKQKIYIYKIFNSKLKNPFLKGLVLHYCRKIDLEKINKATRFFLGKHDFSSFCGSKCKLENRVRTIYSLDVFFEGEILNIKIVGDGFLYNMVRIIVGTLLEISEGKIDFFEIESIIEKKDRSFAGRTEKAAGLYLEDVVY